MPNTFWSAFSCTLIPCSVNSVPKLYNLWVIYDKWLTNCIIWAKLSQSAVHSPLWWSWSTKCLQKYMMQKNYNQYQTGTLRNRVFPWPTAVTQYTRLKLKLSDSTNIFQAYQYSNTRHIYTGLRLLLNYPVEPDRTRQCQCIRHNRFAVIGQSLQCQTGKTNEQDSFKEKVVDDGWSFNPSTTEI